MKQTRCNMCNHYFQTTELNKNIRCPRCGKNASFSVVETSLEDDKKLCLAYGINESDPMKVAMLARCLHKAYNDGRNSLTS